MKHIILSSIVIALIALVSSEEVVMGSPGQAIPPSVYPWSHIIAPQYPPVGLPIVNQSPPQVLMAPSASSPWTQGQPQTAGWPWNNGLPVYVLSPDMRGLPPGYPVPLTRQPLLSYYNPLLSPYSQFMLH